MLTKLKKLILLLGDGSLIGLALILTLRWRYPLVSFPVHWSEHWPHFLIIGLIWLIVFYINGLYNLNLRFTSRRFFRAAASALIINILIAIFYFYLNPKTAITPKTTLAIFSVIFTLTFSLWRLLYQSLESKVLPKENLAVIGNNAAAELIQKELANNPGAGYKLNLVCRSLDELEKVTALIKHADLRALVIADDFGQSERLRATLFTCLKYRVSFFNYPDFYELLTGKVPVEAIGQDWFLENLQAGRKNYFVFLKRVIDLIGASLIFIISLPLWLIIALGVKFSSSGPIFFRQLRMGQNEKTFSIIKFRTMREKNNDRSITLIGDERITPWGVFLRQTRLDEIPQVINILRGEMSFIGPRPERPEIITELEKQIPFYKTRLLIKPGLTGWDQISGHYHSPTPADSLEKLQSDLFYLKQRSLFLDLTIALKTIAIMLSRKGR